MSRMPFYLISFTGGLGNQLFQIATMYALAKKYNTTFDIPTHLLEIDSPFFKEKVPIYTKTIFSEFFKITQYSSNFTQQQILQIQCQQFDCLPSFDMLDCNKINIYISGMQMNLQNFISEYSSLQDIFYLTKMKYSCISKQNTNPRICICFRTYTQEQHPEWAVNDQYYLKALTYLMSEIAATQINLYVYTDDKTVEEKYIKHLIQQNSDYLIQYFIHEGKRDNQTDVQHFFEMFDCDHYILCNSTYHYWPALFSKYNENKIVIYPSYTKDGKDMKWFTKICPENWTCI
jgi:hypothetical protein